MKPVWLLSLLLAGWPAHAVLFYSSGDSDQNTLPPSGDLAGSGWHLQGAWGRFTGTPIGPHHFLTARHVGGAVGETFRLGDRSYVTTQRTAHPHVDLAIWRVDGEFPTWAELYEGDQEVGERLVVFGRGRPRGAEVHVRGASPSSLRGWRWGRADGKLRWGENAVTRIWGRGDAPGSMLYATFDRGGGENEAHLTTGDSGGGVFLREEGRWRLAGIAISVDQRYALTAQGPWFDAAIFDVGGLYHGNLSGLYKPDTAEDQPHGWYAVRLAPLREWIREVAPLSLPAPLEEPGASAAAPVGGVEDGADRP